MYTEITNKKLSEMIVENAEISPNTILVQCNNVRFIINAALIASKQLKTHDVYYQPNHNFYADLEIDELSTAEFYKESFKDYCNYFDKHRVPSIINLNKTFYNYSNNNEKTVFTDYPSDRKMIIIVENYNFWDLKSQFFMARLHEENPNIIVIGQLRTDFNFAINHISDQLNKVRVDFLTLNEEIN